jgi:hypothetical protein
MSEGDGTCIIAVCARTSISLSLSVYICMHIFFLYIYISICIHILYSHKSRCKCMHAYTSFSYKCANCCTDHYAHSCSCVFATAATGSVDCSYRGGGDVAVRINALLYAPLPPYPPSTYPLCSVHPCRSLPQCSCRQAKCAIPHGQLHRCLRRGTLFYDQCFRRRPSHACRPTAHGLPSRVKIYR